MRAVFTRLTLLALGLVWLAALPGKSYSSTTWSAGAVTAQTLPRGKTTVKVLELKATQNNSTNTLNGLTLTRVNGADTDISSARLWVDANASGVFEPGTDTQIGTAGPFSSGKKTFSSLSVSLTKNTTRYFWVTVDVSTAAIDGARLSASLNASSDVSESGSVLGAFPMSSLGTTASNGHLVSSALTFANTVPPANCNAGDLAFTDFQVTYSDGSLVTGFSTLPTVTTRKGGAFQANAVWSTLNAETGQYRASWTVPAGASAGSDYDFDIQALTGNALGNSGPGTNQASSAFTVSGGATQSVTWIRQLLSAQSQPRSKVQVPVLVLWGINNNAVDDQVLNSVKVTRVNGADSDITSVHLFVDSNDGQFTPATDLEIGTAGAFVGGTYTFSGLNLVIARNGGTQQLFVAFDVSGSAAAGARLNAKVDIAGDLVQNPYTVSGAFPLSSLGTGVDSGHLVDPTISLIPTAQPGGAKARETVSADYRAEYSDGTVVTNFGVAPVVGVREGGTGVATAVWSSINAALGTYRVTWVVPDFQTTSSDYDFLVTASSGSAGGNAGPATGLASDGFTVDTTLTFVNTVPPANGNAGDTIFADFQVTFSGGAPVTNFSTLPTVTVRKGGVFQATTVWSVLNVLTGQYRASWVVPLGAFSGSDYDFHIQAAVARALGNAGPATDQATSTFAISGGATQAVAWMRQLLASQSQPRGKTQIPVLALSGTNNNIANDQVLNSVKVTRVNGADSDITTVHLFVDTGDGQFTPATDSEIGNAGAFAGGTYTFSGLNLIIARNGGTRQLFVAFDLSGTATAGARLNAKIDVAADLAQGPYSMSGSFPLSSLGTGVDSGHLVNPTLTLVLTAQPGRAKARETVSADYRAEYSDGTAVTNFGVAPVVSVREGGTEVATAAWSPLNTALGTYRATWVVPDFQATSSNYSFLLTASSGSAGGNFGPATGLASNSFTVDTQLTFSIVKQPLPQKAGDTVVAEYAVTFSDGTAVPTLDATPTLNVRLGITNVAVPNWSVFDSSLGRYRATWKIPDFQATSPNYNIALFAGVAKAAGNKGTNAELASADFSVDTSLRFTLLNQPKAGTARDTVGCDLQVQYSDGGPVASFDPLPKVKIYKGSQEMAAGAWDVVKPGEGKYRISWVIPDFQTKGPDYVLRVMADSAGSAGNVGPTTSHSTATFSIDTSLSFKAEAQPAAAAIGDDAWMEFTIRRGFDSAPVQQFDRSPTVLVFKEERNVGSASWSTVNAAEGRYKATWSVPPTQASGTDYTLRVASDSGTRSGLRGPDATLTSGAFTVTARSLFWGSLPVDFRVVPAGSKHVPVLAILVHNAGENSQVVKGMTVTSLNSNDSSVSTVHLFVDDGNQKFASGPNGDPEIGEPGPFRSAKKEFLFTDVAIGPGSDRVFFVAVDVSDKANSGELLKASIEQKGDLRLGDGVAVKGSFPLFSLEAPHQINTDLILDIADQPDDISRGSIARMIFTVTRPDGTQVNTLTQEPTLEIVKGNMPVGMAGIRTVRERPGTFEARWDSAAPEFAAGSDYAMVIRANSAQEGKNTGPARTIRSQAFGILVNIADRMSFHSSDGILQGCVGSETTLETKVTDGLGVGVEGVSVAFSLPPGSDPTTQIATDLVNSGPDGMARVKVVIGQRAGRTILQAIRTGLAGSPLNFSINGAACIADGRLSILAADPVSSVADGETPVRVMAYIRDAYGNPVEGKTIQFFTPQSSTLVIEPPERMSDSTGTAEVNAYSFEEQSLTLHATVAEESLTLAGGVDIQYLALPENRLFQSFPNPFDPRLGSTTIRFNLATAGPASLIIYDSTSEPVRTVFQDSNRPAGPQSVDWDGKDQRGKMLGIGRYRGVFTTQDYRKSIDMVIHSQDKGCFVATTVYGNPFHPNVLALKRFRDSTLSRTSPGRWFIGRYYQWSPRLVRRLKDKPALIRSIRWLLDRLVSIGQAL
ncbi:MAG: Ig-like domain-containing protein [Nitrospirae bacterium]|nr:Ig-like domain-containing protein [Nitrospirota bacterium]